MNREQGISEETENRDLRHYHVLILENELGKLVNLMDSPIAISLIEQAIYLLAWSREYETKTWNEGAEND